MSKSEKAPHPFKVGDHVTDGQSHGTVTQVRTQKGDKHHIKVNHATDSHRRSGAPAHMWSGGKWDIWEHASYYKKADLDKAEICMPKKKYTDEHKKLIRILRNPSKKKIQEEIKEQSKDLAEANLEKGSRQARFPFNPQKDLLPKDQRVKIDDWQNNATREMREGIDTATGNARVRFLDKLAGKTTARHSKTGGREFLLHRGESGRARILPPEPTGTSHDTHAIFDQPSSWTPDYSVANKFAHSGGNVTTAWVHENDIMTVPKQYGQSLERPHGRKNKFADEHEVIVQPRAYEKANYEHTPSEVPKKDLNARINQRSLYRQSPLRDKETAQMSIKSFLHKVPNNKSDDLEKGSRQRKIPFNPEKDLPSRDQQIKIDTWQHEPDREDRDAIQQATGNVRTRFLDKLAAKTTVRHSKKGGREFLLHRGESGRPRLLPPEPAGTSHDTHAIFDQSSSWTPRHDIATNFAHSGGSVDSAWVHENDIMTVPKQYGKSLRSPAPGENIYSIEHEVIVKPHVSERANFKPTPLDQPKADLDARITQRGQQGYAHLQTPERILAHFRAQKPTVKSELDLFETLEKALPEPRFLGEKAPDGNHHAIHLKGKKLVWDAMPHYRQQRDNRILNQARTWLQTQPKEHHPILKQFINKVMQDPYRHLRYGSNVENGPHQLRARHIESLISGSKDQYGNLNATLTHIQPNKLNLAVQRHGTQFQGVHHFGHELDNNVAKSESFVYTNKYGIYQDDTGYYCFSFGDGGQLTKSEPNTLGLTDGLLQRGSRSDEIVLAGIRSLLKSLRHQLVSRDDRSGGDATSDGLPQRDESLLLKNDIPAPQSLTLYHGTPSNIAHKIKQEGFKNTAGLRSGAFGSVNAVQNLGNFFSDDSGIANFFGSNRTGSNNNSYSYDVLKVKPKFKNTLDLNQPQWHPELRRMGIDLAHRYDGIKRAKIPKGMIYWLLDKPEFVNKIKDLGYDSVKFNEGIKQYPKANTYMVFDPEHVEVHKSELFDQDEPSLLKNDPVYKKLKNWAKTKTKTPEIDHKSLFGYGHCGTYALALHDLSGGKLKLGMLRGSREDGLGGYDDVNVHSFVYHPTEPDHGIDVTGKFNHAERGEEWVNEHSSDLDPDQTDEEHTRESFIQALKDTGHPPTDKYYDAAVEHIKQNHQEFISPAAKITKSEPLMKPYVSEAQRKWAHTDKGTKALGGKKAVKHWDKETKGKNLPEKIAKEEAFAIESLSKNTKTYKQMLGDVNTHKDAFETAKKMPNSNWGTWLVRNYKKNPEKFKEVKDSLVHYAGSQHLQDVANVRFSPEHDFDTGLTALKTAENNYNNKNRANLNLADMPSTAKKILDVGNGMAWWSLGKPYCESEGKAMGHCGNKPSHTDDHDVLSLRTEHMIDGAPDYEPHLTFINDKNTNTLGEMKGRANKKPHPKYHDAIVSLINQGYYPLGGGYAPDQNFHIDDLSDEHQSKVTYAPAIDDYALLNSSHANDEIKYNIAKDRFIKPESAALLSQDPHHPVRAALAKNPYSGTAHHEALANDSHDHVKAALAQNRSLSEHLQEKLFNDHPKRYVLEMLARNPKLSIALQEKLAEHESPLVRESLSGNVGLLPHLQEKLAEDDFGGTLENLALRHDLTPEVQKKLSNHSSLSVRIRLASSQNLLPETQAKLAEGETSVKAELAQNPHIDPKIWFKLANDPSGAVQNALAKNPNKAKFSINKSEPLNKMPLIPNKTKKPYTTVYRMQNKEGVSPYGEADVSSLDEHGTGTTPMPEADRGFSEDDLKTLSSMPHAKFGFESLEHAHNWFTPDEISQLAEQGFTLQPIKAKKVWSSGKQAFFEHYHPRIKKLKAKKI